MKMDNLPPFPLLQLTSNWLGWKSELWLHHRLSLSTVCMFLLSPFFSSVTLTSYSLPLSLQVALQQHWKSSYCINQTGCVMSKEAEIHFMLPSCLSCGFNRTPDRSETRLDAMVLSFLPLRCDAFFTLTESRQRSGGPASLMDCYAQKVSQNPLTNTGVPYQNSLFYSHGNTRPSLHTLTNLNVCLSLIWSHGRKTKKQKNTRHKNTHKLSGQHGKALISARRTERNQQ